MKPAIWLRVASVLTLVHAVLHTIGGVFGKPAPGPESVAVAAMQANQFLLMGHMRTFFDFYRGMGLAVSIFLTIEAVVFWQLASLSKRVGPGLRPILATFTVAYLAMAINSYEYFFFAPVIVEILIAACIGIAIATVKAPVTVMAEKRVGAAQ
ncbi:MAG TPA: hypothetical protein VGJ21_24250 [Terracidiphilus sp.]|jgi:hypothetical protein